jgi:hypothetical protein
MSNIKYRKKFTTNNTMSLKCKFCKKQNCDFDDDELGRTKKACVNCVIKYKASSKYKHLISSLFDEHGLCEEDIEKMTYIGGSEGYHLDYHGKQFPDIEAPAYENFCLCGSQIKINCYLKDLSEDGPVIVIGSCCQEKYLSQVVKKCVECGETHASKQNLTCRTCKSRMKQEAEKKEQRERNKILAELAKQKKYCACRREIKRCFEKCYTCFISKVL